MPVNTGHTSPTHVEARRKVVCVSIDLMSMSRPICCASSLSHVFVAGMPALRVLARLKARCLRVATDGRGQADTRYDISPGMWGAPFESPCGGWLRDLGCERQRTLPARSHSRLQHCCPWDCQGRCGSSVPLARCRSCVFVHHNYTSREKARGRRCRPWLASRSATEQGVRVGTRAGVGHHKLEQSAARQGCPCAQAVPSGTFGPLHTAKHVAHHSVMALDRRFAPY